LLRNRLTTSALLLFALAASGVAQVSIPSVNTAVTENFNSLANTGTTASGPIPTGWAFLESPVGGSPTNNTEYRISTGTDNNGDTYSYGASGNNERAFGMIQSGSNLPSIGASFTNNTGVAITTLRISYRGELWRTGTINRTDRIDFQYSTNATGLGNGTWTDVNNLDYTSPAQTTVGAKDGNTINSTVTFDITGLNIAAGATFWIRYTDFNTSGADDGIGVDDFSITANPSGGGGPVCPTITLNPTTLPGGTTGVGYNQQITAMGGVSPYVFSFTGTLPTNLTLSGGGVLSGTPTAANTFNFTVIATDSTTPTACTGSQAYSVTISAPVTITNINQIQGPGLSSPVVGTTVTTEGIVTAVRSNAYYLQNAEADYDANPNTSEAILVFGSPVPVVAVVGNRVRVTGTVTEFVPPQDPVQSPITEITSATATTLVSAGNALPAAVTLTTALLTPNGGQNQLERFEFMRVSGNFTVVAPTGGATNEPNATGSSDGLFHGVLTGTALPFREAGIEVPTVAPLCAAGSGCAIPQWDGNPEVFGIDSNRINGTTGVNVRVGQTFTGAEGVLDFGFRHYQFYPTTTMVPAGIGISETLAPVPAANDVTIATFNVERFFDTVDELSTNEPILTTTAFNNRLNKISRAIRINLRSPDVIGFQEVENLNTLQAIATKVAADGGPTYTAFLAEGNDIGGIDVGFLYKSTVTVSSVTQEGSATQYTSPCTNNLETLNDRPPVVLRGTTTKGGKTMDLVVIVNHLRSLNGIDEETPCTLSTDGQRVRVKRAKQAEFLASLTQTEQTANPNARVIVLGDMNAFEVNDGYTDSIATIRGNPTANTQVVVASPDLVNPNLLNMLDAIPNPLQRFSFVFAGNHQTLDHILYTANAAAQVTGATYVRMNSEFPEVDRNDSTTPLRLSDHDPGVLYLTTATEQATGIQFLRSGYAINRTTNIYSGTVIIRNNTGGALTGPFTFVVSGLPNGVTLNNATGTNLQGAYIVNNTASIPAGGNIVVPVQFLNPSGIAFNYTPKFYLGAF
jgi:uncharacterized protein